MKSKELKARQDLAAAYRLANFFGFSEGIDNHLSLLVPGKEDRYFLIPYGLHWSEVKASSFIVVDGEGKKISGDGYIEPSAFLIHGAVHKSNKKNVCVMHTHMESALAITMLKGGRLLMAEQNALRFYGKVNYLDKYEGVVLDNKLAAPIGKSLIDADVLFLANHGVIVTGKTVHESWELLYFLEKACKAQILAMSQGKALKIVEDNVARKVVRQIEKENSGNSANSFRHFEALKRMLINEGSEDFLD